LWAYIWGTSLLLSQILSTIDLRDQKVLEIGAGSGLCSMISCAHGAASVLTTDIAEEALDICAQTAVLNSLEGIGFRQLNWYDANDFLANDSHNDFNLFIGSDILYMGAALKPILALVQATLRKGGCALIADPGRPNLEVS